MKREVIAFIVSLGAQAAYSGKQKTLFITDKVKKGRKKASDTVESIELAVLNKFGFGLHFTLKTNK
jgi:hypothetical protein